jgi:MFS family permease
MYQKNQVFMAACAGLAFFGVTMLALGPVLSHLGAGANALPATLSAGIIIGTAIFGPVTDKFGYKGLLIAGSLMALLGIQGLAHLSSMSLLHVSTLLLGVGGGILNGETNALVADIYDDRTRGGRLSLLGACYCAGALLWTLLNYFFGGRYALPLHCVSAVMLAVVVFFCLIRFPQPQSQSRMPVKKVAGLLKSPALLLFALILFFQHGIDGITGSFTVGFLENARGMPAEMAALSLTCFTGGMFAGRLPMGFLMKKLSGWTTLRLYLCAALAGAALLHFLPPASAAPVYAAAALTGFGVGATCPVIYSYMGRTFRELSGTVFSTAIFIALIGQFLFNKGVGMLFDGGRADCFPAALAFAVVMMLALLPVAKRRTRGK